MTLHLTCARLVHRLTGAPNGPTRAPGRWSAATSASTTSSVLGRDGATVPIYCEGRLTMYLDKPMRAHGLMQAIARVNRVFRDKPGGLVVD